MVFVGDEVPNFSCDSHLGMITSSDIMDGHFSVLVTFPKCFGSVGSTELAVMAKLEDQFEARDVVVLGLTTESRDNNNRWVDETESIEDCKINFPLICDVTKTISNLFGCVRSGYGSPDSIVPTIIIIDAERRVRVSLQYTLTCGRNFYEVIRSIDSLQLSISYPVSTPVNWGEGQDVFINDDIDKVMTENLFPRGVVALREWFQITPQP
uniref:Thioredoxin domain-containing protein n=1 Tax=Leptocylindrus danicus TaxID=163516 RepID=A0A7S2K9G6_9STRA|mmetsp:Transcript_19411/g.28910  ORF Transcript_19411/g.28910 Transcript_19411/m.28910 type:complete len:210 (+) Transcript_19411:1313-1942(+)|eukprot:CAMPEP_0116012150 /NCGR_PEP_ID=MMETSP0321-20121206/4963_1 /TAXON_ID=163516 /ORGANISM="Leptocylindrus danicus var. danicus, Strain B650" /LENGTH=209 /DNA_ID=CAMNT_0003481461 /DNA_START=1283 /DNA_END=1912 /DNA_ORIENTATION=-